MRVPKEPALVTAVGGAAVDAEVRVSISTSAAERVPLRLASVVVSAWSFSAMEAEVTEASGCVIRPGDGDGEGLVTAAPSPSETVKVKESVPDSP